MKSVRRSDNSLSDKGSRVRSTTTEQTFVKLRMFYVSLTVPGCSRSISDTRSITCQEMFLLYSYIYENHSVFKSDSTGTIHFNINI